MRARISRRFCCCKFLAAFSYEMYVGGGVCACVTPPSPTTPLIHSLTHTHTQHTHISPTHPLLTWAAFRDRSCCCFAIFSRCSSRTDLFGGREPDSSSCRIAFFFRLAGLETNRMSDQMRAFLTSDKKAFARADSSAKMALLIAGAGSPCWKKCWTWNLKMSSQRMGLPMRFASRTKIKYGPLNTNLWLRLLARLPACLHVRLPTHKTSHDLP